jgi:alkylhydroperoxidase family enzyme
VARYTDAEIPDDVAQQLGGFDGNYVPSKLYRLLANNPAALRAWVGFAWSVRLDARTPRALRELLILRTAQLQQSAYEWQQHRIMAREAGVPESKIAELAIWQHSPDFDPAERAALRFTEAVVRGEVDDETHAELEKHFGTEERLELTLTAALYCMVPRVLAALGLKAEEET